MDAIILKNINKEGGKRSSLLSGETLPDVKDVFAIVFREESHRGIASSSSGSILNLRKVGHTVDRGFDFIEYPPGYNKNPVPKLSGFKTFNANTTSTSNENGTSLSFTNDHIMKLMSLINDIPSGTVQANMTCRDSGVNQHMTISTANMFGIIDITDLNLTVGHPNGFASQQNCRDWLGHPSDQAVDLFSICS
ncbi:hypothetical protein Tco_1209010 [Tanacetum coccineum]